MIRTPQRAETIPPIDHKEAMNLAATENSRLLTQIRGLTAEQWQARTECTEWSVRDIVVHLIGSAQGQASPIEFIRQVRNGRRLTKQMDGRHWVDGLNEAQLRARAEWTPAMLPELWQRHSADALHARRRMPAPVRALPILPIGTGLGVNVGWQPLRYLFDIGFTRDIWMHRIDIARAIGVEPELTPQHDGRILADIVAEWSRRHAQPYTLTVTGPAGGAFCAGDGNQPHPAQTVDAAEFAATISGRAAGTGILRHKLPL